eukprot:GILK01011295.1.p1 GENE.GILK01011295.1~~GILK01011295.1.p1  ORF type:complete len:1549 (+),score=459.02 GILK01011295.1:561-4649(+)
MTDVEANEKTTSLLQSQVAMLTRKVQQLETASNNNKTGSTAVAHPCIGVGVEPTVAPVTTVPPTKSCELQTETPMKSRLNRFLNESAGSGSAAKPSKLAMFLGTATPSAVATVDQAVAVDVPVVAVAATGQPVQKSDEVFRELENIRSELNQFKTRTEEEIGALVSQRTSSAQRRSDIMRIKSSLASLTSQLQSEHAELESIRELLTQKPSNTVTVESDAQELQSLQETMNTLFELHNHDLIHKAESHPPVVQPMTKASQVNETIHSDPTVELIHLRSEVRSIEERLRGHQQATQSSLDDDRLQMIELKATVADVLSRLSAHPSVEPKFMVESGQQMELVHREILELKAKTATLDKKLIRIDDDSIVSMDQFISETNVTRRQLQELEKAVSSMQAVQLRIDSREPVSKEADLGSRLNQFEKELTAIQHHFDTLAVRVDGFESRTEPGQEREAVIYRRVLEKLQKHLQSILGDLKESINNDSENKLIQLAIQTKEQLEATDVSFHQKLAELTRLVNQVKQQSDSLQQTVTHSASGPDMDVIAGQASSALNRCEQLSEQVASMNAQLNQTERRVDSTTDLMGERMTAVEQLLESTKGQNEQLTSDLSQAIAELDAKSTASIDQLTSQFDIKLDRSATAASETLKEDIESTVRQHLNQFEERFVTEEIVNLKQIIQAQFGSNLESELNQLSDRFTHQVNSVRDQVADYQSTSSANINALNRTLNQQHLEMQTVIKKLQISADEAALRVDETVKNLQELTNQQQILDTALAGMDQRVEDRFKLVQDDLTQRVESANRSANSELIQLGTDLKSFVQETATMKSGFQALHLKIYSALNSLQNQVNQANESCLNRVNQLKNDMGKVHDVVQLSEANWLADRLLLQGDNKELHQLLDQLADGFMEAESRLDDIEQNLETYVEQITERIQSGTATTSKIISYVLKIVRPIYERAKQKKALQGLKDQATGQTRSFQSTAKPRVPGSRRSSTLNSVIGDSRSVRNSLMSRMSSDQSNVQTFGMQRRATTSDVIASSPPPNGHVTASARSSCPIIPMISIIPPINKTVTRSSLCMDTVDEETVANYGPSETAANCVLTSEEFDRRFPSDLSRLSIQNETGIELADITTDMISTLIDQAVGSQRIDHVESAPESDVSSTADEQDVHDADLETESDEHIISSLVDSMLKEAVSIYNAGGPVPVSVTDENQLTPLLEDSEEETSESELNRVDDPTTAPFVESGVKSCLEVVCSVHAAHGTPETVVEEREESEPDTSIDETEDEPSLDSTSQNASQISSHSISNSAMTLGQSSQAVRFPTRLVRMASWRELINKSSSPSRSAVIAMSHVFAFTFVILVIFISVYFSSTVTGSVGKKRF